MNKKGLVYLIVFRYRMVGILYVYSRIFHLKFFQKAERDFSPGIACLLCTAETAGQIFGFFLQTIPLLVRTKGGEDPGAEGGDEEEKEEEEEDEEGQRRSEQHRLNALASMLPHLPQQALLSELPVILPVLVKV